MVGIYTANQVNTDGEALNDAVVRVDWKKTCINEDGVEASYLGKSELSAETVSSADFIDFETLTEDRVKGWVIDSLDDRTLESIDKTIQRSFTKRGIQKRELPW